MDVQLAWMKGDLIFCSEETDRDESAWQKRAGHLGKGRLGIAEGFVGAEEL